MNNTGTVIVSALVGAAIGYGVAKLTTPTVLCSSHILTIDPNTTQPNLGDQHVCVGKGNKSGGNRAMGEESPSRSRE